MEAAFAPAIERHWSVRSGFELIEARAGLQTAPERAVTVLRRPAGTRAIVSPAVRSLLPPAAELDEPSFRAALRTAGIALHAPDRVFAVPSTVRSRLLEASPPSGVRVLGSDDGAAFDRFAAEAPAHDLDDAFVELDHWLVVGAFLDGRLVAAGSAYPWDGPELADIGVITLPDARGRGWARNVVQELCRRIIGLGAEPQYRSQLDNAGSLGVARSAGLAAVGDWEVVEVGSVS